MSGRTGLGQMGGTWGWFRLMWSLRGNQSFLGWVWTDRGTAQFIARRASGAIRARGDQQYDYSVDDSAVSGENVIANYRWRELVAGPYGMSTWYKPPHVSWIYANTSSAGEINQKAFDVIAEEMCTDHKSCLLVFDGAGSRLA